ncbi:hypothetical protein L210DRAFT_3544743, partial [Boletus edulis BED1]
MASCWRYSRASDTCFSRFAWPGVIAGSGNLARKSSRSHTIATNVATVSNTGASGASLERTLSADANSSKSCNATLKATVPLITVSKNRPSVPVSSNFFFRDLV